MLIFISRFLWTIRPRRHSARCTERSATPNYPHRPKQPTLPHTNPPKLDDALDAPNPPKPPPRIRRTLAISWQLLISLWLTHPALARALYHPHRRPLTWGKVKQQVPWVNNQPFPPPPPAINRDGDPTIPNGADGNEEEEEEEPVDPKVKNAFARAYVGYRNHAYPRDELINGQSLTAVEALSPLRLMDMKADVWRTVRVLERKMFANLTGDYIPFFETTVRYLGGYLSAYAFSGEKLLLDFGR
ncbi:glycoside hydrolase [Coprinopsis sp. MPI-PUGE-AT-0042]|nr:glycoside hydrolase [Coprinopsis sp. MPI-PUGE-AT-0042]